MQKSDNWASEFFALMEKEGENIDCMFELTHKDGSKTPYVFKHYMADGITGFIDLSKKLSFKITQFPKLPKRNKPNFIKRVLEFFKWSLGIPFRPYSWTKKAIAENTELHSATLSSEEINKVEKYCKDHKISSNSLILHSLQQAFSPYMNQSLFRKAYWMIPVGLYDSIDNELETQNNVSFVDISFKGDADARMIDHQVRKKIFSNSYWGTAYSISMGKYLGTFFYSLLFKFAPYYILRNGTFSNVGQWEIESVDITSISTIPPVTKLTPIGATALQVNGVLSLGLMAHGCTELTNKDIELILVNWKNNLINIEA